MAKNGRRPLSLLLLNLPPPTTSSSNHEFTARYANTEILGIDSDDGTLLTCLSLADTCHDRLAASDASLVPMSPARSA